jgi:glycosyltransferase involved in cell wall biosynthesis
MDVETSAVREITFPIWRSASAEIGRPAVSRGRRVAILISDLNVGGVQKTTLTLAGALAARGHVVDLLVLRPGGALTDQIPAGVRVVQLAAGPGWLARLQALAADPSAALAMLRPVLIAKKISSTLCFLPDLVRYLREVEPEALLSATPHLNIEAVWARQLAGVPMRLLISERNAPSQKLSRSKNWRHRYLPSLMLRTYPKADVVVAVSTALADDLAAVTGLPRHTIRTIHNPVVGADLIRKAGASVSHPWLTGDGPPVLLGVGRLSEQKDFPTLLRAFARVRAQRPVRLIILGGSNKREDKSSFRQQELRQLATRLGVEADMDLPGFVHNPFAFMARASVFVLSSRCEGLPGVLIQALACGCQVVSTDCPTGPSEILEDGRYGALVPIGDDVAMAAAIEQALVAPLSASLLRSRAAAFSEERSVDSYLEALFGQEAPAPVLAAARVATA